MQPAIATDGLSKRYGSVSALGGLSLRVEPGEIFGFLGPNGAGKTTTIRLLLGLLRPTAGTGDVLGQRIGATGSRVRGDVGYLPGELALWSGFTGWHTLRFLERMTQRPAVDRPALIDRFGLTDEELRRPVRTYSDGMKQKIGLVQALQCRPRLAFLDEPTKGLDPLVQQAFYDALTAARAAGMTIFFSSHILSEVERVCDRVAMLRAGALVASGTIESVLASQRRRVRATFTAPIDRSLVAPFGELLPPSLSHTKVQAGEPSRIDMLVPRANVPALVLALNALPLVDLTIEPMSLEDAFLEHYR